MGSSACKAALGATTDEPAEPEHRHLAREYSPGAPASLRPATTTGLRDPNSRAHDGPDRHAAPSRGPDANGPAAPYRPPQPPRADAAHARRTRFTLSRQRSAPLRMLLDLIQYINGTNMSVERLADVLSEKTGSRSWVVVFKALVTVHHLMVHGNERFIQHLASRNSLFTLHNFLDKSVIEGYTMSTFIRRYSRYLNEKSLACRLIALDITKTKRGMDGMMRTLDTKQLLNTLLVIQIQFDALLNFNANPDEVTNGVMHAAFTLLFKDSLRLFAAYNEGILNLLDKFFGMTKNQCKESLDIYIKFLERTTKMAHFLKVAEQVGIDQNDIPYLTQAPYSLLEALKQHLASLEEKEDSLPPYRINGSIRLSAPESFDWVLDLLRFQLHILSFPDLWFQPVSARFLWPLCCYAGLSSICAP
ncbi:phosphatidylinositol-binding clathrin assembly protein-like [Vulpes vulpes]|uniref:Phosphatidylinositol-binding clathrin assembly protein-like n=1 Tax=Vulpes vulpes TaxID=9627 RepID=A0ABM4ZAT0_VULVU